MYNSRYILSRFVNFLPTTIIIIEKLLKCIKTFSLAINNKKTTSCIICKTYFLISSVLWLYLPTDSCVVHKQNHRWFPLCKFRASRSKVFDCSTDHCIIVQCFPIFVSPPALHQRGNFLTLRPKKRGYSRLSTLSTHIKASQHSTFSHSIDPRLIWQSYSWIKESKPADIETTEFASIPN